jgi:hypothetical protein
MVKRCVMRSSISFLFSVEYPVCLLNSHVGRPEFMAEIQRMCRPIALVPVCLWHGAYEHSLLRIFISQA